MLHSAYEMATPDVIAETLDGEVLIVNLATGVYFRGDSETAQAWTAVTSGMPPTVNDAAVAENLEEFVGELMNAGLIRERSAAEPPAAEPAAFPPGPFRLERFEDLQDMLALDPIHDVDPAAGWPQPR